MPEREISNPADREVSYQWAMDIVRIADNWRMYPHTRPGTFVLCARHTGSAWLVVGNVTFPTAVSLRRAHSTSELEALPL